MGGRLRELSAHQRSGDVHEGVRADADLAAERVVHRGGQAGDGPDGEESIPPRKRWAISIMSNSQTIMNRPQPTPYLLG